MEAPNIITRHVFPPIPVRDFDWCAFYDGEEGEGNYGWGRTEFEAIQDFKDNCQEDHDYRLGLVVDPDQLRDMRDDISIQRRDIMEDR